MAGWNRGYGNDNRTLPMGQVAHDRDPRRRRPSSPATTPPPVTTTPAPPPVQAPTAPPNTPPASGWSREGWQNPLYDPQSGYGGTAYGPGQWTTTGAGDYYLGQNPETAWTRRINETGLDPFSAKGQNLRGLWGQVYEGYKAAAATNPGLRIQDYVAGLDPNMLYNTQTQTQRGESPGRFAGRARTISRAYGG